MRKRALSLQKTAISSSLIRSALLVLVCCAALWAQAANSPFQDPREAFQAGQQELQGGRLEAAEAAFREVLRLDPNSVAALANLGVVYMRMERYDDAVESLEKAARLAPGIAGIQLNLGLALLRQNRFADAIPRFRRAMELEPQQSQARYLLGLSQYMGDDYEGAVETLEPLYPEFSSKMDYLYILGSCHGKAGREREAARVFEQMFRVEGDSPRIHWLIGNAYLSAQLNSKAVDEFEKARGEPTLPYLHYSLALGYYRLRKLQEAEDTLEEEIRRNPGFASSYGLQGAIYLDLRQLDKAIASYQKSLETQPGQAAAHYGLGRAYMLKGELNEAMKHLERAKVLKPDDDSIHFQLGQVYRRAGRKEESAKEFARAQELQAAEREMLERKVLGGELPPSPVQPSNALKNDH